MPARKKNTLLNLQESVDEQCPLKRPQPLGAMENKVGDLERRRKKAEYMRKWLRRNPHQAAKNRARAARFYRENKAAVAATQKEYRKRQHNYLSEYFKNYRSKHIKKCKKTARAWKKNNKPAIAAACMKRRALKMGASIKDLRAIREFIRNLRTKKNAHCYYCGLITPIRDIHVDHIIALALGGSHSVDNLCSACSSCNLSKGAKALKDWNINGQFFFSI